MSKLSEFEQNALTIYNHFGQEPQLEKLIEEANELVEAVRNGDIEHIVEELADVFLMLNEFQVAHGIDSKDVAVIIAQKVERTLDRIETKYYEHEIEIFETIPDTVNRIGKEIGEKVDQNVYNFLKYKGYEIDIPPTQTQLENIRKDLEAKGIKLILKSETIYEDTKDGYAARMVTFPKLVSIAE